ncbi:heavy metal translocating P-type ATPase [Irregularibacter muris]|uniref:Heavy metal translocating P-type ATPase n=1 Tax=Irregularibacter muris TaxID=1796619 RepID=A0AAE3HEM0_9FIRM|nr:heavy metal translocating P-type ATPase [Irregularibacter muris]MCR1897739.1 heavy metal translocating P-type ATPase [Irregularibacter muris]
MSSQQLLLKGLNCVNCASKIEENVNKIDGVKKANINFVAKTLNLELRDGKNTDAVFNEVKSIVKKFEPSVEVTNKKSSEGDHSHHHHGGALNKNKLLLLGLGVFLFALALIFPFDFWIALPLFVLSYLLIGGEVLLRAIKNISRGQVFDENFLMSIATIGAFAIGQFSEGISVMLFYQIGELFQDLAVGRSRKSIKDLMDIRPDHANLKVNDEIIKVAPENIYVGDYILVKPGEKVPLDGVVSHGQSMVDTSALTGESVPRKIQPGEEVLGGFINKNGVLTIKVTKTFGESTVSKVLDLIENAGHNKAKTEQFMTKFSRYYTPIVVYAALALAIIPPLLLPGATFHQWVYRSLVFLVISCPCALVISIPLGFFGGIGGASKRGILVKGGNYLEALNNVDTVVMDKTGTLTKGVFNVIQIQTKGNIDDEDLLKYAAYAEVHSTHPIAISIVKKYNQEIDKGEITDYKEIAGQGIKAIVMGKKVLIGNARLMTMEDVEDFEDTAKVETIVHIALEGKYIGYILIADEIKEDAKETIKSLKELGVRKTVMLTGDKEAIGKKIAKEIDLDVVYTDLLPNEKVEKMEDLEKKKQSKGHLIFVGDGINDAPVLARADIGVAMGGLGSDAAIEAADIVLMTDEPSKLISAIKIAKKTRKIVFQNIIFALGIKTIVLLLGAFGVATMWEAVFADVGVSLIAILNSLRALRVNSI